MKTKDIAIIFGVTAAILMIPLVGMQVSDELDWNLFDFVIIGTLLVITGLLITLATKIKNTSHRLAVIIAILGALILTCIHLAVGIIDNWPFAGS